MFEFVIKLFHSSMFGLLHLEEESVRYGMEGMIVRKVMRMSFVQNSKVKSLQENFSEKSSSD